MATISNLELNVTANTTEAKNRLEALSQTLRKFKDTSSISNGLSKLSVSIFNLNSAINGIKAPEKLVVLKESVNRISNIKAEKLETTTKGIENLAKSLSAIDETTVGRMERLASALSSIAGTNKGALNAGIKAATKEKPAEAVRTTPANSDMEKATASTNNAGRSADNSRSAFQRLHDVLSNVRAKLSEVGSAAARTGAEMMRAAATAAWNTLRIALNGVRRVFNSLTAPIRKIIHSIGRIAFYRALRTIIKEISKGIKEGIENLARFSKLMEEMDTHNANRVMSLYASNLLYLKNAIATAIIPVLKSLEPVFDAVIKKTVDFINVLSQLFSFLSGSATYTRAKYYYIDFADSLDKASGSAGKLNKQLAQFDELNNLTTSAGRGGSDNELDYLKMFEDPVPIEDWVKNLTDGDWSIFGKTIADKITQSLKNMDWESIKESARDFGTNLAGFLNGFLDEEMFAEIGSTLAQGLNTAVNFAFGFGEEFDGGKFGKGIANGINAFFRDFDFNKLGLTLRTWASKLGDALKSAVDTIDWAEVHKSLGDFLDGLGIDKSRVPLYQIPADIQNLKVELEKAYENWGVDNFWDLLLVNLEADIENIKPMIKYNIDEFTRTFVTTFRKVWETFPFVKEFNGLIKDFLATPFVTSIKDMFSNAKEDVKNGILEGMPSLSEMQEKYVEYFRKLFATFRKNYNPYTHSKGGVVELAFDPLEEAIGIGKDIAGGLWAGIKSGAKSLALTSARVTFDTIKNAIKTVFGIASPAKNMYDVGENIVLGIIHGMTQLSFFSQMQTWFENNVTPWFSSDRWNTLAQNVKTKLSNTLSYNALYQIGTTMGQGIYNAFSTQLNSLYDVFAQIKAKIEGNPITQKVTTVYNSIGGSMQTVAEAALEIAKTPLQTEIKGKTKGGTEATPTWHNENLPTKPSNMPTSSWNSYLENWKKTHQYYPYYYEKGGYPPEGSMFVAGERGAELVGNFNGRTGVANNDQILTAMYSATYDAMSKALSENETSIVIEGDSDSMFRAFQRKANDFYRRTGRPAIS